VARLTATPQQSGNLTLRIAENQNWGRTQRANPIAPTAHPVLCGNKIIVPKGELALVEAVIESPSRPTEIRFRTDLASGSYVPVAPSLLVKSEEDIIIFCDDNRGSTETHSWHFGLLINGTWYDPQIENVGDEPPSCPPTPEGRGSA